ncbi:MAG: glyceraldehyde 3-phosphate dehydrogenase NAD-binding domain-containing protein [Moraxellaceae bacterium]|nr:glyceraldehyde 3-phosphate dehydrogenase NAD-binding domain-containing protein [Moraxellaceae bacterium]
MTLRIGINGFGRIGRLLARLLASQPGISLSHINDPALDPAQAAHLLYFDSVHGRWAGSASATDTGLVLNGRHTSFSRERDIASAWRERAEVVVDCSGRLRQASDLAPYWEAGIRRVLVSAPVEGIPNIVVGVNDHGVEMEAAALCAASCTTNCLATTAHVLHEEFNITSGFITTIHGLTNDQALMDQAHEDWRRGRAGGSSLIPTTSGFAKAIGRVLPTLEGRLDGFAIRAPIANASLIDASFVLGRPATATAVNDALRLAAAGPLCGILAVEDRPLVSADFRGDSHSAVIDSALTRVMNQHLLKVVAWYDNETGYSNRLATLAQRLVNH